MSAAKRKQEDLFTSYFVVASFTSLKHTLFCPKKEIDACEGERQRGKYCRHHENVHNESETVRSKRGDNSV